MPFSAIIFDLDGTLLNTLSDLAESANRVIMARGFPGHPRAAYKKFVGDGAATLVRRILPAGSPQELADACLADFLADYRQNWKKHTAPYDGIPDLLSFLKGRGVATAVLSNKPHPMTELNVAEFFGKDAFSFVLGEGAGFVKKPDPDGALHLARGFGLAPSRVAYLGDTATDMDTATTAGMYALGALWGFREAEELLAHGAKKLFAKPGDLVAAWDSLSPEA
ncbi:MAG: HAD family hydrolase [Thermodesulfobacteriota bacterium]